MGLSVESRSPRSGNSYNLKSCPRMSAEEKQPNEASKSPTADQPEEGSTKFSPKLIEEKIKANLEPLRARFSTLMQMIRKTRIPFSRTNPSSSESPFTDGHGTSRTLPLTSLVPAGYSLDSMTFHQKLTAVSGKFALSVHAVFTDQFMWKFP